MNLSKELAKQAAGYGICKEWHKDLLSLKDKKAMVEMYLRGIDFCLSNDYPSNDFIRKNFGDIIAQYNIYVDGFVMAANPEQLVALGSTTGNVRVNDFGVSRIYVKHNSKLKIKAEDNAFVMIDVFDNSSVEVEASESAKVCINRYGDSKVLYNSKGVATIKVVDKHKKTY